jgi:ribosome biogenesis GTPase
MMAIVVAPQPAPDLLMVDRLLVQCRRQGIKAALVVNKSDLDPALAPELARSYAGADLPVIAISALTGEGLDPLESCLAGETVSLSGQSGVGKSTLTNSLLNVAASYPASWFFNSLLVSLYYFFGKWRSRLSPAGNPR